MKLYRFDRAGVFSGVVDVEDSVFTPPRHTRQPLPHDPPAGFVWVMRNGWVLEPDKGPRPVVLDVAEVVHPLVDATQQRLDAFARTRNYDGILSLCTYAASAVPKFAAEGQYGVMARDVTWAKLYEVLAEVQAGTRPVPTAFADIEPELPVLEWPV